MLFCMFFCVFKWYRLDQQMAMNFCTRYKFSKIQKNISYHMLAPYYIHTYKHTHIFNRYPLRYFYFFLYLFCRCHNKCTYHIGWFWCEFKSRKFHPFKKKEKKKDEVKKHKRHRPFFIVFHLWYFYISFFFYLCKTV